MAMFHKPKGSKPAAPALCDRCKQRPGVAHLSNTAPPGKASEGPAFRDLWICAECVAEIRRYAAEN
jgi:hypothetical protein